MKIIKKYKDTFIGIGTIILIAFLYYQTLSIEDRGFTGSLNSATIPQWICYALWALSLVLIVQDLIKQRKKKPVEESTNENTSEGKGKAVNYPAVAITFALIAAYTLLIWPLGFCPASTLFMFFMICVLSGKEHRNYLLYAAISVAVPIAIYSVFRFGLNLMLPRGIMPF